MNIEEKLSSIGLKTKEAKAYVALFKLRKANAHQVAKEAKLQRTAVYPTLNALAEKGLINKTVEGKRIYYIAESPALLKEMISKKNAMIDQMIPLLSALQGSQGARPVIKFYEHQEGIRKVLTDSLAAQEKLRRDLAFVDNAVEVFGKRFLHHHIEERVKNKIHVKSLRRKQTETGNADDWYLKKDNDSLLRETRYLSAEIEFDPLIIIYDHIVAIISSKQESFAVVIESLEFSKAMKMLFDIAWETGKK